MIMETFSLAKGESHSRAGSSWERSRPLEEMNQIAYECLHSDLDKARLRGAGHASPHKESFAAAAPNVNRGAQIYLLSALAFWSPENTLLLPEGHCRRRNASGRNLICSGVLHVDPSLFVVSPAGD